MRVSAWLAITVLVAAVLLQAMIIYAIEGGDFPAFYWAGRCIRTGDIPMLYDQSASVDFYTSLVDEPNQVLAFVYHPIVAYLFLPLSYLPFGVALRLWMVLQLGISIGAVYIVLGVAGTPGRDKLLPIVALVLVSAPLLHNQALGQTTSLMLGLCALMIFVGPLERPVIVGALWGLTMLIKPITGTLILVWWRKPRILIWALVVVLSATAVVGGSNITGYVSAFSSATVANAHAKVHNPSLLTVTSKLPYSIPLYVFLAGVVFLLTTIGALRLRSHTERLLLALASAGIVSPVLELHHLMLALLPFVVLLQSVLVGQEVQPVPLFTFVALTSFVLPFPLLRAGVGRYLPLIGSACIWLAWMTKAYRPAGYPVGTTRTANT